MTLRQIRDRIYHLLSGNGKEDKGKGGICMEYKALDVAKYIIDKCTRDRKPISNLQLQKILYFIQKECLKNGTIAFHDDIEAWQFGPVVPDVYYRFCGAGAMPITLTFNDLELKSCNQNIFDKVIEERRGQMPWNLVNETHTEGGAWDRVYQSGKGDKKPIPLDYIREDINKGV